MTTPPSGLEGTCKLLPEPAPSDALRERIATEYAALAAEYGPRNVLVLKRHPAGLDSLRDALAATDTTNGSPRSPRVESLPEHASKTLEEHDPTLDRLEYEERIELISLVIDGASRDVPPYLELAADHESFGRDVGQLLLEATRQQLRLDDLEGDSHECLAFLYAMNDRFHAELEDRRYVERADVIPRTVDLLESNADGLRDRVSDSVEAVLAVEFEEYRRLDRRYLAAVTDDSDLVCLGERHASIERTRVEPGCIEDHVGDGLAVEILEAERGETLEEASKSGLKHADNERSSPHRALTRLLATGTRERPGSDADPQGNTDRERKEPVDGRGRRIRTGSAREQARAVASEIQALRDRHGWSYDEFAVAVPRIERVPETRKRLRESGIPTATVGTPSLAEDPVVNECYAFVTLQCARERDRDSVDARIAQDRPRHERDVTDPDDVAIDRLRARVEEFSPELLEACTDASVSRSLERWIRRTDLKGRIAREEAWVDAREQYASIRRVLEIARFVEETDLVGPDWQGLRRMLRRTIQYDAPYVHAVETQPPTGGVTVCSIDDCKYDSREAVFLLDLIDDTYPGEQFLTQLFPTAWLGEMEHYPAVTDPDVSDVTDTFATVDPDEIGDPFESYHAQRARRRLALGARAARTHLYCCSYERGSGGLRRTYDESRYLQLIDSTPGLALEGVDTDTGAAIHGERNALEALLAQPHGELERILREASTGGEADLGETEALFEEIAVVLEEGDIDAELAEAVRSQFEFAAGEVVRRD